MIHVVFRHHGYLGRALHPKKPLSRRSDEPSAGLPWGGWRSFGLCARSGYQGEFASPGRWKQKELKCKKTCFCLMRTWHTLWVHTTNPTKPFGGSWHMFFVWAHMSTMFDFHVFMPHIDWIKHISSWGMIKDLEEKHGPVSSLSWQVGGCVLNWVGWRILQPMLWWLVLYSLLFCCSWRVTYLQRVACGQAGPFWGEVRPCATSILFWFVLWWLQRHLQHPMLVKGTCSQKLWFPSGQIQNSATPPLQELSLKPFRPLKLRMDPLTLEGGWAQGALKGSAGRDLSEGLLTH